MLLRFGFVTAEQAGAESAVGTVLALVGQEADAFLYGLLHLVAELKRRMALLVTALEPRGVEGLHRTRSRAGSGLGIGEGPTLRTTGCIGQWVTFLTTLASSASGAKFSSMMMSSISSALTAANGTIG
jgi:hypothetical protein